MTAVNGNASEGFGRLLARKDLKAGFNALAKKDELPFLETSGAVSKLLSHRDSAGEFSKLSLSGRTQFLKNLEHLHTVNVAQQGHLRERNQGCKAACNIVNGLLDTRPISDGNGRDSVYREITNISDQSRGLRVRLSNLQTRDGELEKSTNQFKSLAALANVKDFALDDLTTDLTAPKSLFDRIAFAFQRLFLPEVFAANQCAQNTALLTLLQENKAFLHENSVFLASLTEKLSTQGKGIK